MTLRNSNSNGKKKAVKFPGITYGRKGKHAYNCEFPNTFKSLVCVIIFHLIFI